MGKRSADVDAYIRRAQPFARAILRKLRTLFHRAGPHLDEQLKWGAPTFVHKGIVGGMAAFKQHVGWGLWKAKLLKDAAGAIQDKSGSIMGGGKLTSAKELPPDRVMVDLIKQAVVLNERGAKTPGRGSQAKRAAPRTPPDLTAALKKNAKAAATYAAFTPSCKREYVEWITEARQDATRQRRLTQAIQWMAQGKSRNWKYKG
jgi:uncharacterized protein YdeI (YjbR/CyaY-like superfamily)